MFIDKTIDNEVKKVAEYFEKHQLDSYLREQDQITLSEQKELCEISAPTFKEEKRGIAFKEKLENLGLSDITIDEVGNVIGYIYGSSARPKLLLSAHLDTVFPIETDVSVKEVEGKFFAPGIGDNTRGLAEVLSVARSIKEKKIPLEGTLMICGNVCEEGLGDLIGIKHLFKTHGDIDGYMTPDGGDVGTVRFKGTGSKRYEITFKGTGGHSFGDFGIPNPIHALGRAISSIADIRTKDYPKTTFSVGLINGGTSINTIAESAKMSIDLRSNDQKELEALESKVLKILVQARDEENRRWKSSDITVEMKAIGSRPSGSLSETENIVQTSCAVANAMNIPYTIREAGSTDANIPISLGIPAIQVGFGGSTGGTHTLAEWYDTKDSYLGPKKHLLTVLSLLGIEGITSPILEKRD